MKAKPRFTANNICYLIETIINQNILLATNDQNNSLLADNDLNIACSMFDNSNIAWWKKWLQYIDVNRHCFLCEFHNDVYLLIRNIIGLQKYSALWTAIMQKERTPVKCQSYLLIIYSWHQAKKNREDKDYFVLCWVYFLMENLFDEFFSPYYLDMTYLHDTCSWFTKIINWTILR